MDENVNYRPLVKAGLFLGIGLGGFVDGILFHQLLQFHGMLTGKIPKDSMVHIQVNMFWDGLFHALTWLTTVLGIVLLWRAGKRADVPWAGKTFVASMFLGWGLFNLVEGIIDHHILNLHHVVEALGVSVYDYAFLASGVIFILGGWWGIRSDTRTELIFHPLPRPAPNV